VDEIINTGPYPTHEVICHFRFISAIAGRTIEPETPRIPWRDWDPPLDPGGAYAVLNPGSNEPSRRWPMAGYSGLARRLLDRGLRVVIVGGGHFGSFVPCPKEITPPTARFVYKEMECYHCFWRCHLRANKHQIFPRVGGIGEERVWDACEALLGAGPGAP